MLKSRSILLVLGLILVVSLLAGVGAIAASADTPTPTPSETATPTATTTTTATPTPTPTLPPELKLACDVPSYSDNSGSSFSYTVNMTYSGTDTIMVALSTINPPGWTSYITYTSKEVTSLPIGPLQYGSPDSKSLSINLSPVNGA